MTGYKVVWTHYPGNLTGDEEVWLHDNAAQKQLELLTAKQGEWETVKLTPVEYDMLPTGECRVGRVIHLLNTTTRRELVRANALAKLTDEELEALGLPERTMC